LGSKDSVDPRTYIIPKRLEPIKNIVPVMSYKGGVGKTIITSLLAISLNDAGYNVGLLDLDFTNPSLHIVLGVDLNNVIPKEEKGVLPPKIQGIKLMSIAYYTRGEPTPLRGEELSDIFKEILSVTIWDNLDFLLVDLPPTLSDILLETLHHLRKKSKPIIVTTTSKLSIMPTINLMKILRELYIEALGVILNMSREGDNLIHPIIKLLEKEHVNIIGVVHYDEELEYAIGSIERIRKLKIYKEVSQIVQQLQLRLSSYKSSSLFIW
jgi:ATPases involved in chromosome partitioning